MNISSFFGLSTNDFLTEDYLIDVGVIFAATVT